MTSTSVTTAGGVVVVTQVIPKDGTASSQQAPPPTTRAPPPTTAPSKMDAMTASFLRGEPQGLGIVQIFIGVLCVLFSLTSVFSPVLVLHAPLSLSVAFVVSGSLVAAAAKRTSVGRVWASLVSNLISTLLGLGGVAYVCWLLAENPAAKRLCDSDTLVLTEKQEARCVDSIFVMKACVYGLQGLLLVLLVLQVCVTITVSVFSVRALQRRDGYATFKVEVGGGGGGGSAQLSGTASKLGSDVALLDSE